MAGVYAECCCQHLSRILGTTHTIDAFFTRQRIIRISFTYVEVFLWRKGVLSFVSASQYPQMWMLQLYFEYPFPADYICSLTI